TKILNSVDVLFNVVNGTVTAISNDASNRHAEAILQAKKALQSQVDFYNQLAMMYGGRSAQNMSMQYNGAFSDITSMGLPGLVSNLGVVRQLGGDIMSQVEEVFKTSFANPYTSGSRQNLFSGLISGEWQKIASGQETGKGVQGWLGQARNWPGGEVGFTMAQLNTNQGILEDFLSGIQEKLQKITDFFSNSVTDALVDGFSASTDKFGVFYSSLKENLASAVSQSLIQGFTMTEVMPLLMSSFGEKYSEAGELARPSLTNLLEGYSTGKYDTELVGHYTNQMISDLSKSIDVLKGPLSLLYEVMGKLDQTLGVNTTAVQSNTSAVLGPVNSYLQSLSVGSLAPHQSMAELAGYRNTLYQNAYNNPDQFSAYASYMSSTYLPEMQGVSSNYAGIVNEEKERAYALPWYTSGGGSVEATSMAKEASRGRSLTESSVSTPSASGASGSGLAQEIANLILPALLDIKETIAGEQTLKGDLNLKGDAGTLVARAIREHPAARQAATSAAQQAGLHR
ncbi:MAG: hypothetical protein PHN44_08075, partial [Candidatus Marinimicrobia bacterium]|nr:hypothetical protein [Candidatus Neomarinimicrobiota bacterium]